MAPNDVRRELGTNGTRRVRLIESVSCLEQRVFRTSDLVGDRRAVRGLLVFVTVPAVPTVGLPLPLRLRNRVQGGGLRRSLR